MGALLAGWLTAGAGLDEVSIQLNLLLALVGLLEDMTADCVSAAEPARLLAGYLRAPNRSLVEGIHFEPAFDWSARRGLFPALGCLMKSSRDCHSEPARFLPGRLESFRCVNVSQPPE